MVVWFTGLSGSGKTTLSLSVHMELVKRGIPADYLDADELRRNLTRDLGFTKADRDENVRRIAAYAKIVMGHGMIALVSAIAPYREIRNEVRASIGPQRFIEVYVNCPLEECERRDPKCLYRKARAGKIAHFTGIDDPYEPPLRPDVEVRTDQDDVAACVSTVMRAILRARYQDDSDD